MSIFASSIRKTQTSNIMKKIITTLLATLFALVAMTSCGDKEKPDYKDLIVGQWEVTTYYHWNHDFTDESISETTCTLPDTTYQGYDSAKFNANGTTRWHMCDLWVSQGSYSDPYRSFEWRIDDDSLLVSPNWVADNISKYAIKKLDRENLVIEEYTNNGHADYNHHHREQIHRYTFRRVE